MPAPKLRFHPLTAARWDDLEALFGPRGASGGCWCMWFRIPRSEFREQKGEGNRRAFRRIVASGRVPGILAYEGSAPVGWCAVEPREAYPAIAKRSPEADRPVWSVTCFYVARSHRRKGVTTALLRTAKAHVKKRGGKLLEGYPVLPRSAPSTAFAYPGYLSAFEQAGFRECARHSPTRPIVRLVLK